MVSRAEAAVVGSSRVLDLSGSSWSTSQAPAAPASPELQSVSRPASREGSLVSCSQAGASSRRRRRRVREAVISDQECWTEPEQDVKAGAGEGEEAAQLAEWRAQFGEAWLSSGAGEKLHSLLGLQEDEEGGGAERDTVQDMVTREVEAGRRQQLYHTVSTMKDVASTESEAGKVDKEVVEIGTEKEQEVNRTVQSVEAVREAVVAGAGEAEVETAPRLVVTGGAEPDAAAGEEDISVAGLDITESLAAAGTTRLSKVSNSSALSGEFYSLYSRQEDETQDQEQESQDQVLNC